MAFPLIAAATMAGVSAYGKYKAHQANQPIKGKAFRQKANTGYLRKYMSDLQGRSASRARTELAMRPALRMIGAQQRQGQRQLAYQAAQQGLEGSGIEAQKQLALQAGTTKAVAGMGESVMNQELARARQMQAAKEGQRMKIAGQIGQREGAVSEANRMAQFNVNEKYRQQQIQHGQQSKALIAEGLANVATSAISAGMTALETDIAAGKEAAGIVGEKPGGTVSSVASNIIQPPLQTTGMYNQSSAGVNPYSRNVSGGSSAMPSGAQPYTMNNSSDYYIMPDQKIYNMQGVHVADKGAEGGRVTKDGIAQYYNGGNVDIKAGLGAGYTKEEELIKKLQSEQDVKLAKHEEKVKIEAEAKKQHDIGQAELEKTQLEADKERFKQMALQAENVTEAEAERQKKFETGQLESETERIAKIKSDYEDFATTEAERQKMRSLEEARQADETEQFYKSEDERRQTEALKFASKKRKYDIGEKERIDALTGGTTPDQLAFTEHRKATEKVEQSPEYTALEEKTAVLKEHSIGEKDLEQAKKDYQAWYDDPKEDRESFVDFDDFLKTRIDDGSYKTLSKRKIKKLSKKYGKKMDALLPQLTPTGTEEDIQAQITPGEEPKYEFKEGEAPPDLPEYQPGEHKIKKKLVAEDLPEYQPGETPKMDFERKEFVKEEYKPKYTAEAPTLQAPTEKELRKMQTREIYKQLVAGIDVGANIAKAKTQREEMEFAKLLADPNVDPNQLFQTSYGEQNPMKVVAHIQELNKVKSEQFADTQESIATTNIVNAMQSGDPAQISDVYQTPEYAYLLQNDPDEALSMFKTGNTAMDKIARSQATDQAKADKWIGHRDDLRYTLWGMDKILMGDKVPQPGQQAEGAGRILQIINDPSNAEGITQAHLTEVEGILNNMRSGGAESILADKGSASGLIGEGGDLSDDDFWGTYIKDAKFEKILKGLNNFVREEGAEAPPPFDLSIPEPPIAGN